MPSHDGHPIAADKGHDASPSALIPSKYVTPSSQSEASRRHYELVQEVPRSSMAHQRSIHVRTVSIL